MKKIKKFLFLMLVCVMFGTTSVNAMTEDQLKEKLTASYTINGAVFKATPEQVTQIERYLSQNEISSADADYIASKVDATVAVIENGSATEIKNLTNTEKDKIVALLNEVSNNTSVKLTVSKGSVTVYNTDGTTFSKITTDAVKYTDSTNVIIIAIASFVVLAGVIVIGRKLTKKENA